MQNPLKGSSVLKLLNFGDSLSSCLKQQSLDRQESQVKPATEMILWQEFVARFFSASGVLRQQFWCSTDQSTKQYEISTSALARYYWTHFTSGVQNIRMVLEDATEKDLPYGEHVVVESKSCFIYSFANGHQVR